MPAYRRPYFERYLEKRPTHPEPRYPYAPKLLKTFDSFELFVLDGGAFFFTNQHLGAKSAKRFTEAFLSGELLAPWIGFKRIKPRAAAVDWFAAYDPEKGPWAPGQKIEQHVWLHRWYFLQPLAREYFRTGNRRWARSWYEFFYEWRRRFPAMGSPPPTPNPKATAYLWHDMQVTWRLLTLLHGVFLLGNRGKATAFSAAEWGEIYKALAVHARWLYAEVGHALARAPAECRHVGNHFLQKGLALICAGTLYPEMDDASSWVAAGRRVVRMHVQRDVYRDGGSVEASPSYSHFIAGLHLQAFLMLKANGLPPIPGLESAVRRQYDFLESTMSPSGRTLQLGDSYALNARDDLSVVRRLFPLPPAKRRGGRIFSASRFAVLRSAKLSAYVDAMDVGCGHIHPAKPNVLVFAENRPLLVDCGCVNYDSPLHRIHFASWPAHNVVVPGTFADEPKSRRDVKLTLETARLSAAGGEVRLVCRHDGKQTSFVWRRIVNLSGNRLEIHDRLVSPRKETFALLWHWAENARHSVKVFGTKGELTVCETTQPAINEENREYQARTSVCRQTGKCVEFHTVLVV